MPPVLRWVSFHNFGNFLLWGFWKCFPCLWHEVALLILCSWCIDMVFPSYPIDLQCSFNVLITLCLLLVKCSNYFSVFKAWYLEHPLNYYIFQGHFYLTYWSFISSISSCYFFHSLYLFIEFHFPILYWIPYLFPMFVSVRIHSGVYFCPVRFLWTYL